MVGFELMNGMKVQMRDEINQTIKETKRGWFRKYEKCHNTNWSLNIMGATNRQKINLFEFYDISIMQ